MGAARKHLPSQEAVSPGRAHLQTGAAASSEGSRSAAALWTADTAQPWAPGAGGGQRVRRALFPAGSPLPMPGPLHMPPRSWGTRLHGPGRKQLFSKGAHLRGVPSYCGLDPGQAWWNCCPTVMTSVSWRVRYLSHAKLRLTPGLCGHRKGARDKLVSKEALLSFLTVLQACWGNYHLHFPDGASEAQSYHLVRTC